MKYAIGIDPGVTQTGLVLRRGNEILAHQTYSVSRGECACMRVVSLADVIVGKIDDWIFQYDICVLDTAIETPIYNSNPKGFELQWRLVQAIETGIIDVLDGFVGEIWITEVGPTASKKLSTGRGNANKPEIAAASPFEEEDFPNTNSFYTIADAWSHSLAAWEGCKDCNRIDVTNMVWVEVGE